MQNCSSPLSRHFHALIIDLDPALVVQAVHGFDVMVVNHLMLLLAKVPVQLIARAEFPVARGALVFGVSRSQLGLRTFAYESRVIWFVFCRSLPLAVSTS